MWPWEHAVIGYLVYSAFCHLYYREPPGDLDTFVLVVAGVVPDLIDKPLAWEYGVFETGYGLGHSIFFAVPLGVAAGVLARRVGYPRTGIAFGLGYVLHIPADLLYHLAVHDVFAPGLMLWPLATSGVDASSLGFTTQAMWHFNQYTEQLFAGEIGLYLGLQLTLAGAAILLWLYDGAPVLRGSVLGTKRLVASVTRQ